MSVLVLVEHDGSAIKDSTLAAVTAGAKLGDRVITHLETGDAAQVILRAVERERADLVVMGSRGLGEIKGLLQGSVSHKIAQLAPCPCLTVK